MEIHNNQKWYKSAVFTFIVYSYMVNLQKPFKNSLIIDEENTKKNHKRVVSFIPVSIRVNNRKGDFLHSEEALAVYHLRRNAADSIRKVNGTSIFREGATGTFPE
jgi:hypothetical protein